MRTPARVLEVGERFGRLTIVEYVGYSKLRHMYNVKCDCGNTKQINSSNILCRNGTKSCGCLKKGKVSPKFIDLTGRRFGKLVVLSRSHTSRNKKEVFWDCQCDCGTKSTVKGSHLRGDHSRSCGCQKGGKPGLNALPDSLGAFNSSYCQYRNSAGRRNRVFNLTKDEFRKITQSPCFYCGSPPSNIYTLTTGRYVYNGIDRKDNDVGYILENCVPCCEICNKAKRGMPFDEFLDWIRRLVEYQSTERKST